MSQNSLQETLEQTSGVKLKLKINDNHSTMMSIRRARGHARVSLHRMFLNAPQNVMQALACYIKGEHKVVDHSVKAFIESNIQKLDYSPQLDQGKLSVQGTVYNLQQLFDSINAEYFNNELKLLITWFGKPQLRSRSRVTFGLYQDPLKLIKINRILDSPSVPQYLISYVIYHEMLHAVCPAYYDNRGLHQIHSREFKAREAQFRYYRLAQAWIREQQHRFF